MRLARERAEALTPGQMVERARPMESRWPTTREDGRNYIPRAAARPTVNPPSPEQLLEIVRPPPPVWRTAPLSSAPDSPASSVEDLTAASKRQRDRGEMAQNFRFPQVPKLTTAPAQGLGSNQSQQLWPQSPQQQSPSSPAWPLPKASRAQVVVPLPTAVQNAPREDSDRAAKPAERESVYSRPSEPNTPLTQQDILRQASLGRRGKSALTSIRNPEMREEAGRPKPSRANTIDTLSAAIAAGMAPSSPRTLQSQPKSLSVRMPFADDSPPSSPLSMESSLEPPRLFRGSPAAISTSGTSANSSNPLLGLDPRPGMSDKIPSSRRPPRLNIEAVREAEARGSTTSLSDLIRRATKLASNLDRGKTASSMGMLDMFNAGEKGKRASGSISDILSAFPEPGTTPTSNGGLKFPLGSSHLRNGEFAPHDSLEYPPHKPSRRCCGMSLTLCIISFLLLLIVIAAAITIPILLIVVPRTSASLGNCSSSHVCQNNGISVVNNDTCSCVCIDGFTGDHCQQGADAECATADITIGGKNYNTITAGNSLPAIWNGASKTFSIPLNSTALLSLFSTNNLTCTTENSLVSFNVPTQNQKRFLPIHPQQEAAYQAHATSVAGAHVPSPTNHPRIPPIEPRAPQPSTVSSTNGIVFQASSTTSVSAASSTSSTSSAPSSTSTSTTTPVSAQTLSFAQVVVLYVLEQSNTLSIAVNAQQTMQTYLANVGGDANGTLSVGSEGLPISADFGRFEVLWANGSSVGGLHSRRWVDLWTG